MRVVCVCVCVCVWVWVWGVLSVERAVDYYVFVAGLALHGTLSRSQKKCRELTTLDSNVWGAECERATGGYLMRLCGIWSL